MNTLHYAGKSRGAYGWGICNENLERELEKHFVLADEDADIVFQPLADHDFNPATSARGRTNLAYTFFEYPLGANAARNAARYDIVFCGSTWCLERMKEAGITNGRVLIQGVDQTIFPEYPPIREPGFRIFSGGKFEWRKGQDLVIAAFRRFIGSHPNSVLVAAWSNPWFVQLANSMMQSPHIRLYGVAGRDQDEFYANLLETNGIRTSQYHVIPHCSQRGLSQAMWGTHVGLFPNRCEGGTNLVLMEYASLGRPVVANTGTGHADIAQCITNPIYFTEDKNHWSIQTVDDIVSALESAYEQRPISKRPVWTWEQSAKTVIDALNEHTANHRPRADALPTGSDGCAHRNGAGNSD